MVNPAASYRVIGVAANRIVETTMQGAPGPSRFCAWAKKLRLDLVVRYYPSKRGWMVSDVRKARKATLVAREIWLSRSIKRFDRVFPNEDSAVMWAMIQTGAAPEV